MAFATLQADIELAARRRVLKCRRVIAIDGIIFFRVDARQEVARVLAVETAEEVFDLVLARVGRRRQQIFALDLALQIKGQPCPSCRYRHIRQAAQPRCRRRPCRARP